jgi:hypothetical protein
VDATARLQKLFTEGIRALDVAEPLPSFDAEREATEVRRFMEALGTEVAGLRTSGHVRGYVLIDDLASGSAVDHMRPFADGQVLPEEAGLHSAIEVLDGRDQCFIATLGSVGAVVRRQDVDKPAGRMWLFGNITLIEMIMSSVIAQRYPGDGWKEQLSESRLDHAETLMAERCRRGQRVSLLECIQLADKAQILLKDPEIVKEAGFSSRREGKEAMKRLQSLRNSLAHSQEILGDDWPAIARLAQRLTTMIGRFTERRELIDRARAFAMEAHDRIDHRRKYTNEPYWVHLEAVASTVSEVTRDAQVLAAAWLHDVVEDTPVTSEEIRERFGERVATLVDELTDCSVPGDGNRAQRQTIDRAHSATGSPDAKTIKLADVMDNVSSIAKSDPKFGRVYVVEKEALLEVLGEGDARLLERARSGLADARRLVGLD